MVDTFRLTCSVVLWGGRDTANKWHWHVFTVSRPHWVWPHSQHVCFPCLHCLGSRLFCPKLSEAVRELYVLPRSKPLRFRYSGSPQRCRLSWARVLYPSQIRAAQVTRCLVNVVAVTCHLPCPCCLVFWVYNWCTFSGGCWLSRTQEVSVSKETCCSLVDNVFLGLWLPP